MQEARSVMPVSSDAPADFLLRGAHAGRSEYPAYTEKYLTSKIRLHEDKLLPEMIEETPESIPWQIAEQATSDLKTIAVKLFGERNSEEWSLWVDGWTLREIESRFGTDKDTLSRKLAKQEMRVLSYIRSCPWFGWILVYWSEVRRKI